MDNQKTMIITGASRGIGAAAALIAARKGWSVCVNYASHPEKADEVVQSIQEEGGTAIAIKADVTNEDEVQQLVDTAQDTLGPVPALINNAGIACA